MNRVQSEWCLVLLGLMLFFPVGCQRRPSASSESPSGPRPPSEQFISLMNAGKNHLDQGDATNALAVYQRALALVPNDADLRLNLANAHLLAGAAAAAIGETDEVLKLEPNSAAAYFVKGSAYLRLSNPTEAVKALENANKIEPGVTATLFQLGLARTGLKQWEGAVAAFREGIGLDPNRLHSSAHYLLGQALLRLGRVEEAQRELQQHQSNVDSGGVGMGGATFERSKYVQARVPFNLDQPNPEGIVVRYVDVTAEAFGDRAQNFHGPIAVIDPSHTGWNSLFLMEKQGDHVGFRLLLNTNGTFHPSPELHPATPGSTYVKMLVGDLQNDRFDDVVALGSRGTQLFRFATNRLVTDVSVASHLNGLNAVDGTLMDLDFTGKLDLLAVTADTHEVSVWRQFGPLQFQNMTRTSGIPASLKNAQKVHMEDWNRDGNPDVLVSRSEGTPLLLEKQRGGPLRPREDAKWSAGSTVCVADLNNDLRPDLASVQEGKINIHFHGGEFTQMSMAPGAGSGLIRQLLAVDHDNDGWLDLWLIGDGIRVWRNLGLAGFQEQTDLLGLGGFNGLVVSEVHFADFDQDCDSDMVVALSKGGLRYVRNDGGNANSQIKVHMVGNRSNASGIGCRIEVASGGLRLSRTVRQLPVEVGVGNYQKLDSFLVHWFNWPQGSAELPINCREPLLALELTIQEGSCPYLYAWDGQRFRFVTDILGSAPIGLPLAPGRYIESDPEEFVWIGNESAFPARNGNYEIRITEELREVLYLDEAKLVVVDHEPGTEVHTTDKLRPSAPYPPGAIWTLHQEHPLQRAEIDGSRDVTDSLRVVDGRRVSPPALRIPQLRGLAEPHSLILDFGQIDAAKPLVLVMNGWLRFGGGMANIAASHDPSLPFPFPVLEAEVSPGTWKKVDVTVGAPAGKTKTILMDLNGKLEPGTRRLRLTSAFEIHWDRMALLERVPNPRTTITFVAPGVADLQFRGFSPLVSLSPDSPPTPDYHQVSPNFYWTIIPEGWCTRFGDVSELVASRDEGLVLVNSGDELRLAFAQSSVPLKPSGLVRDFFLYVDGWDKDSDFHVVAGDQVQPLPFHGMDDQRYANEPRPEFPTDVLHRKYNSRWVQGRVLKQMTKK